MSNVVLVRIISLVTVMAFGLHGYDGARAQSTSQRVVQWMKPSIRLFDKSGTRTGTLVGSDLPRTDIPGHPVRVIGLLADRQLAEIELPSKDGTTQDVYVEFNAIKTDPPIRSGFVEAIPSPASSHLTRHTPNGLGQ